MSGATSEQSTGGVPLPVGTVTFLLTDVEGSTPMWESSPDAMASAMARHESIVAGAVAAHGGARPIEQGEGDNFVAAFSRASDAAAAALAAQQALGNEPWPDGVEIRVRMALHTGEAHLQEGRTYAGPDLNRCARLRGLAHGGQIVVSRPTYDLLAERRPEGVTFLDLGTHRLKGIERPELVHQLCHPALQDRFLPLTSTADHPGNLPQPTSELVGREEELSELLELATQARLVTITGSGGAGKTRLALAFAHDERPRNPDGVWWVDLAPLADADVVAATVLSVLGGRSDTDGDPLDALVAAVDGRSLIIVLDNAEHLLDPCAELASAILTRTTEARLVVTSREPIGIDGEWSWRIPSLDLPSAMELFARRGRRVRPDFTVSDDNAADVAQVCRRLDGLPLAIELAAARLRMMSPARIAAGLDDRFRLLTGGGRRTVARQQTLQSSVEWSHALLDEQEQVAFRRMAVFAGGFTIEAAEAVLADDALDAFAVLDLVTRLVDKSLVLAEPGADEGASGRYRLLETMRQFAHDRLGTADEVGLVRDRHLSWFTSLAARAEPELTGRHQHQWLDWLEADHDNLRAAADWAAARGDGEALWSLAGDLPLFWVLHGHFDDARLVGERARSIGADVPVDQQVDGRWGSAYSALYSGAYEPAVAEALDVVELATAADDQRALARALDILGTIELFVDLDSAEEHLRQAADLAATVGDDWCRCDALQIMAFPRFFRDDHAGALALIDESGVIAHALDSHQLIGWDNMCRSWVELRTGHLDDARELAEAAIRAGERSGDPAVHGLATWILAEVAIRTGQADQLITGLRRYVADALADGAGMAAPALIWGLALTELATGGADAAVPLLDRSPEASIYELAVREATRSMVSLALRDADGTREAACRSIELADQMGNEMLAADVGLVLGHLALAEVETNEAERRARVAVEASRLGPFPSLLADATALLAEVAAATGDREEAVRLAAASGAVLERSGATTTLLGTVVPGFDLEAARQLLGSADVDRAWAEGAALDDEALLEWVRRSRGRRGRPTVGWDSLTPTEEQVVALVAQGLTNQQIGERLFISAGTVKTHVAHVFAKLDMSKRSEVAAAAARREER